MHFAKYVALITLIFWEMALAGGNALENEPLADKIRSLAGPPTKFLGMAVPRLYGDLFFNQKTIRTIAPSSQENVIQYSNIYFQAGHEVESNELNTSRLYCRVEIRKMSYEQPFGRGDAAPIKDLIESYSVNTRRHRLELPVHGLKDDDQKNPLMGVVCLKPNSQGRWDRITEGDFKEVFDGQMLIRIATGFLSAVELGR